MRAKLDAFFQHARTTGFFSYAIVDGSFVTAVDCPNDIDLILVLRAGHDFHATLRPFEYNMLSKRWMRKEFGFDVLIAREGREELEEYLDFFSHVRHHPDARKGLIRIAL